MSAIPNGMGGSQNPEVTHKEKNLQNNLQIGTEETDINYFKREL